MFRNGPQNQENGPGQAGCVMKVNLKKKNLSVKSQQNIRQKRQPSDMEDKCHLLCLGNRQNLTAPLPFEMKLNPAWLRTVELHF